MPFVVQTSLEPRYCPLFDCQPNRPRVDYVRSSGAMLDPAELPREGRQIGSHKHIPDFINMAGCWCVSEPLKRLVEAHEPDVHAFHLLPLFRRDGSPLPPYFLFDIRQQIDAVIEPQSDIRWWEGTMVVGDYATLALDPARIQGRHVWRGRMHFSNIAFFSDQLQEGVVRAKLKKLRMEKTRDPSAS